MHFAANNFNIQKLLAEIAIVAASGEKTKDETPNTKLNTAGANF
jgi:hypothetical protein